MPRPPANTAGDRVSVLLPLPLRGAYDYLVPEGMTLGPGDFVRVPLGARHVYGVVWGLGAGSVADGKMRPIADRLDAPPLPETSRRFVEWVAAYTLHPAGAVLRMTMSIPAALDPPRPTIAYGRADPSPEIRMTPARQRVLAVLYEGPPRPAGELAREAAVGVSVVRGLAGGGALIPIELPPAPPLSVPDWRRPGPRLSADQTAAATDLATKAEGGGFGVTLLDGVPGSGKTEVYFRAVGAALKRGRQVLVLLPEIALTAQWLARFREQFGGDPIQWHSDLNPSRRRVAWRAVAEGRAAVVVGARSALFLPFRDLGLIVVDEEHDAAFKQEDGVAYNARDMAVVRGQLGDFPVVLVSATPSLETVVNVKDGRYAHFNLPDRHAGALLPEMHLVDMRHQDTGAREWLSLALREALAGTFAAGEQAMLFLNRRGYAPLTVCRRCGYRLQCPRCTAWLVEHRLAGRLQCHHCGFAAAPAAACPACGAEERFAACGPGVERLAEEVAASFPGVRQTIAASDTIRGPRAAEDLVRRIEEHQVDLIIGTQIVAKGYHFPLLTLIGVVDADLGLSGGDLRAAERTYQLLYQVAGRAGRAERSGRVLLQTYLPEHPVMQALVGGEGRAFLDAEIAARAEAGMPPFGRLVALILSGRDEGLVDGAARALGRSAPRMNGVRILGPAPAPMALLRGRHRRRLLLKAERDVAIQRFVRRWLAAAPIPRRVRLQVDVDPYSFL